MKKPYRKRKDQKILEQIHDLEAQQEAHSGSLGLNGYKVLIVDDSHGCVSILRKHLRKIGIFQVDQAKDEIETIDKISQFQPDVILVDIMLPRMNGFSLVEMIDEYATYKPKIIYMTANTGLKIQLKDHDEAPHLFKPIDAVKLHEALEEVVKFGLERAS